MCAGIFYSIYILFFTTVFSNGGGLTSGFVGSLGYWMEQQSVERGSQPWYYYLILTFYVSDLNYPYLVSFSAIIKPLYILFHNNILLLFFIRILNTYFR